MSKVIYAKALKAQYTPDGWEVVLTDEQAKAAADKLLSECRKDPHQNIELLFEVEEADKELEPDADSREMYTGD